ncbi:MAG: hypothetical protein K2J72_01155 [Oscillospiraceae bacterium]|nr:hypothetical protein [Oscillospiraceae bacterium]
MKKILAVLLLICVTASLGGCSIKKEYDLYGKEQVEALRESAKGWQSGRYLLTNLDTDVMDQAFSFMYDEDGFQIYLYEKISDEGNYYAEFSDRDAFWTVNGGSVSVCRSGSEGYVSYSMDNPHPYSTGYLLFYENLFVKSSEEIPQEDGGTDYVYYYNVDKINETLGTNLTEFVTEYVFGADGEFEYFVQRNSDGESSYAYRIDVIDADSLTEIENPALASGE